MKPKNKKEQMREFFQHSRYFKLRGWKERGIWCIAEMREERRDHKRGDMVRQYEMRLSKIK